jgi:hypothetical protein
MYSCLKNYGIKVIKKYSKSNRNSPLFGGLVYLGKIDGGLALEKRKEKSQRLGQTPHITYIVSLRSIF